MVELANRVSALDRLDFREQFVELAAQAIRLRHRHADWFAVARPEDLADEMLLDVVGRLGAWIAEQPPLAVHPDSHLARQDAPILGGGGE